MDYINYLLFGIFPYIAIAVFFIGCWARYDHGQFTWRAGSSQMLTKESMRWASNLFHVGILVIFFGHLVGLLTPHWVYEPFVTAGEKQVMAIIVGGIAGMMLLVGGAMLLKRRYTDPRVKASSSTADNLILLILVVQAGLGMLTILPTLDHLDGSTMLVFSSWAQDIFLLRGASAAEAMAATHWLYKLHIFLGLTVFLIFPFTRLVHALSVPLEYLTRRYQVVRKRA